MFKLLEEYCKTNNKLPPKSDPILGRWVRDQKSAYNNNKMSEERTKKMISIPQFPDQMKEKKEKKEKRSFDELFKLLEEYCKTNNKLPPGTDPILGRWLRDQKTYYNNNKMSEERTKKMISIPQFLYQKKEQNNDL